MSKVLPLLAGLLLASPLLYADEAEKKAAATVEKLGGKVERDDKDPAHPVMSVDLNGTKVTDAGLKELAGLKNLHHLDLRETSVTHAGVAELQKALPKLQIRF